MIYLLVHSYFSSFSPSDGIFLSVHSPSVFIIRDVCNSKYLKTIKFSLFTLYDHGYLCGMVQIVLHRNIKLSFVCNSCEVTGPHFKEHDWLIGANLDETLRVTNSSFHSIMSSRSKNYIQTWTLLVWNECRNLYSKHCF